MSDIFLKDKFNDFDLIAKIDDKSGNIKLRIIHKFGGQHFAEHSVIQVLNKDFDTIGHENINK